MTKRLLALLAAAALSAASARAADEARGVPELPKAGVAAPLSGPDALPAGPSLETPGVRAPSLPLPVNRTAPAAQADQGGTASRPVPAASVLATTARKIPEQRVYSSVYLAPGALGTASMPTAAPADDIKPVDASKDAADMAERLRKTRAALAQLDAPKSLSEVTLDPTPDFTYMASPKDWRDEVLYSVIVDRFARGPNGKAEGDPTDGKSRHGGDLQGMIEKLDYIKGSGVTTLVLSPVTMTTAEPGAYHGYGPIHFMAIDPHLGTMADYKKLVAEAHKRGLRVIFDLVLNHSGPVFKYKDGWHWRDLDKPAKDVEWTVPLHPTELAENDRFTRHGVIEDWGDDAQARNGDFPPDYRHFSSDKKQTQDLLIKLASWWIKETDIDGFRIDALRHINPEFAKRFTTEISRYAASLGKDNFMLLGEHSTGVDAELAASMQTGVTSLYNYPDYRRSNYALHRAAPTRELEHSFLEGMVSLGSAVGRMVRFIDNHDVYRFLRDGEPLETLAVAFAFLLFSIGIPYVYYGTEQGFRQKTGRLDPEIPQDHPEPENRQDMFPEGQFKTASSAGDKFDANAQTYKLFKRYSDIRAAHPALRRGQQYVRWSDPNGPGIYAFSRIHEGEEVVVVMNTADEPRTAMMYVDKEISAPGTRLVDELDAAYGATTFLAGAGSQVTIDVPAGGVRVLTRRKA